MKIVTTLVYRPPAQSGRGDQSIHSHEAVIFGDFIFTSKKIGRTIISTAWTRPIGYTTSQKSSLTQFVQHPTRGNNIHVSTTKESLLENIRVGDDEFYNSGHRATTFCLNFTIEVVQISATKKSYLTSEKVRTTFN